jgi:hypothetical protein
LVEVHDAKAKLEMEGLHVSFNNPNSLWISAQLQEVGGIKISKDACSLMGNLDQWIAIFPAGGLLNYEVPGSLPELVSLITEAFKQCRRESIPLKESFPQIIKDADQYLVGRTPASV